RGPGGEGGWDQPSEPLPDPERRLEPAPALLEVPLLGEVPVQAQAAEQVDREAPAVRGHRTLQPVLVRVVELEVLEVLEPGAAEVEEEDAADVAQPDRQLVDQREAELDVGEERPVAHQLPEPEAAPGVEAAEVDRVGEVPLARPGEGAERQVAPPADRHVLPAVERDGGGERAARVQVGSVVGGELPAPAADRPPGREEGGVSG